VRSARVTVILMVGRAKPPSGDPRFRVTVILMAGRAKPRSGGILIAWGVSPRNTGITTWTSREAATHMPGSQSSSRGDATKQRQMWPRHHPSHGVKPRSGGIFIAWGVSPRNTGITIWTSREAATHMPGSQSSSRGDAAKQQQMWPRHHHSHGVKPRSGGILIAWGVSPRNTGITIWTSREAATDIMDGTTDQQRYRSSKSIPFFIKRIVSSSLNDRRRWCRS
jgi:hypothetical protein